MINNLPVKTLTHKDLTIEGYSRAAVQTYWRIPELKIGFDLGAQPWSFMGTPTWFVSHTHMDHLVALPVYVARRRMMKMEPPIDLSARGGHRTGGTDPAALQPAGPRAAAVQVVADAAGRRDRAVARARGHGLGHDSHTVPSLGFVVWERRRKLKPEYQGLPGEADPRPASRRHGRHERSPHAAAGLSGRQFARRARRLPRHVRGRSADHGNDLRGAPATARTRSTSSATCTSTTSSSAATGSTTS